MGITLLENSNIHPNRLKREANHSIHISPSFPFLVWGNRQHNAGIIFVVASPVVQIWQEFLSKKEQRNWLEYGLLPSHMQGILLSVAMQLAKQTQTQYDGHPHMNQMKNLCLEVCILFANNTRRLYYCKLVKRNLNFEKGNVE